MIGLGTEHGISGPMIKKNASDGAHRETHTHTHTDGHCDSKTEVKINNFSLI